MPASNGTGFTFNYPFKTLELKIPVNYTILFQNFMKDKKKERRSNKRTGREVGSFRWDSSDVVLFYSVVAFLVLREGQKTSDFLL